MDLTNARMIGRKRRRQGRLWPKPVRETDLGHVYADLTIRPLGNKGRRVWTGRALVDTGAADTFVPASVLHALGIKTVGRRVYELADGPEQVLEFGLGASRSLAS